MFRSQMHFKQNAVKKIESTLLYDMSHQATELKKIEESTIINMCVMQVSKAKINGFGFFFYFTPLSPLSFSTGSR